MTTGKAKDDFPGSYIPFDKAVGPVPTVPIDGFPTVQLCVNEDWLPYLVTCLKALSRPETWDDTYDNAVIAASEFAALIASISEGCGVVVPSIMCVSGSFADLDYGFVPTPGAGCVAIYVPGSGWEMCSDATPQGFLQVKREFGNQTLIREVHLTFSTNVPYLVNVDVTLFDSGTFTNIISDHGTTGPTLQYDVTGLSETATAMFINVVEPLGGAAADTKLEKFELCYTGAFPLSVPTDRFTHVFDFTLSDGGWSSVVGTWISGLGWESNADGSGPFYQALAITKGASGVRALAIDVEYSLTFGAHTYNSGDTDGIYDSPSLHALYSNDYRTAPPSPMSFAGDYTFLADMFVQLIAGVDPSSTPGGNAVISKITVSGLGADPF